MKNKETGGFIYIQQKQVFYMISFKDPIMIQLKEQLLIRYYIKKAFEITKDFKQSINLIYKKSRGSFSDFTGAKDKIKSNQELADELHSLIIIKIQDAQS